MSIETWVEFIVYGATHAEIRAKADVILDDHGVPMTAQIQIRSTAVQPTVSGTIMGYEAEVIAMWDA